MADGRVLGPEAGWSFARDIGLTNRSATPCTLTGWVDYTLIGRRVSCLPGATTCRDDPDATRPGQKITRVERGRPTTYVLDPGEYVVFSILWSSFLDDCPGDGRTDPDRAEIRVPGDRLPVTLRPASIQPCHDDLGLTALGQRA